MSVFAIALRPQAQESWRGRFALLPISPIAWAVRVEACISVCLAKSLFKVSSRAFECWTRLGCAANLVVHLAHVAGAMHCAIYAPCTILSSIQSHRVEALEQLLKPSFFRSERLVVSTRTGECLGKRKGPASCYLLGRWRSRSLGRRSFVPGAERGLDASKPAAIDALFFCIFAEVFEWRSGCRDSARGHSDQIFAKSTPRACAKA